MTCVRCPARASCSFHQVDAGRADGPNPGPRTGDAYACHLRPEEISRELGA